MTLSANSGKFDDQDLFNSKGIISLNTPQFSVDLEARPTTTDNETAPSHELWGPDARGVSIQWGVLFPKESNAGNDYFNIVINGWNWRANLVTDGNQDDVTVLSILPWSKPKQQNS